MTIQLRQICLVARELEPVLEDLTSVFGINRCYVDEGVSHFGLENTLMTVGNNFLEVVAPVQENTAAGRYLDRRAGDGGYMVICQAGSQSEQESVRERAAAHDVRIAYEADRDHWNICQFHPRDMIAAFLEVDWDDACDFNGKWMPAGGTEWTSSADISVTKDYAGIELQGDDVSALAKRWSDVTGIPLGNAPTGPVLKLANVMLRFVPATDGRGPGLGGIDLIVNDVDDVLDRARQRDCPVKDNSVSVCGTRFYLIEE